MEDVKKFILSLTEVGLYKARVEEDNKELIFSDNKFEIKTLRVKEKTFDDTEELSVIDIEKEEKLAREKELARKKEAPEMKVVRKGEIEEEEPESYRVSTSKKLFRVAIFVIPILVAGVIFLLNNPVSKKGIDSTPTPQKTDSALDVKKPVETPGETTDPGVLDETTGEIKEDDSTAGEQQGEGPDQKAGITEEGQDQIKDTTTVPVKDSEVKTTDAQKPPVEVKKPEVKPEEKKIETVQPATISTVKIINLPPGLRRAYNSELSKIVIPFVPKRIKVSGYLNVKVAIDEKGKASARIRSSEGLKIIPEGRRDNVLNLIKINISKCKLTPPKDKQGNPVKVSEFSIDYQAGKLGTRLVLKKR